jgi:hypothetical protein
MSNHQTNAGEDVPIVSACQVLAGAKKFRTMSGIAFWNRLFILQAHAGMMPGNNPRVSTPSLRAAYVGQMPE